MNQWKRAGIGVALITTVAGSSALLAQTAAPFPEQQPPIAQEGQQPPTEKVEPRMSPPRAEAPRPPDAKGAPATGVIRPPATGDRGVLAPPNQDRSPTPELRPPGTPGGNPNVQPR